MEKNKGKNVYLGLFVIIGLVLFLGGLYYLGRQRNLFGDTITVYGIFYDVSGLQTGNNVRFSGINVGTVESISINSDTTVLVGLVLRKEATQYIKEDSELIIGSEGLMGSKVINIFAGSSDQQPVVENDTLTTITPVSIDDITNKLAATTENAALISDDLATITAAVRRGDGLIGRLIFDKKLANNVTKTTQNLADGTKSLKQVAAETKGVIEKSENVIQNTGEVINATKKSFLFRGYFRRKAKREAKKKEQVEQTQEKEVVKPDGTTEKTSTEVKKETKVKQ